MFLRGVSVSSRKGLIATWSGGSCGGRECSAHMTVRSPTFWAASAWVASAWVASRYYALPPTHRQLLQEQEQDVAMTVRGLVRSVRSSKTVGFIDVADGSSDVPVNIVVRDPESVFGKLNLKVGQSIEVRGQWQESKGKQASELVYDAKVSGQFLAVVGDVPETYPLQKKTHTLGFLRSLPTLRHRTSTLASVLRFRSRVESTLASVFEKNHFIKVSPPIITASDCEGAGEQFKVEPLRSEADEASTSAVASTGKTDQVSASTGKTNEVVTSADTSTGVSPENTERETADTSTTGNKSENASASGSNSVSSSALASPSASDFFGKPAYLTVSSQLHLEILAASLNRVWTLSPCFRAEYSNTTRHLSEFWMLEAEISHLTDVHELVDFTEDLIRALVSKLRALGPSESGSLSDLTNSQYSKDSGISDVWDGLLREERWPCITYTEAVDILNTVKAKGRSKGRLSWGDSISTEHEKWLAGTHFQSPVFITDYPKAQKPFYMPLSKGVSENDERQTVACYDLIVPEIGELVGGSLREHDLEKLKKEMVRRNMDTAGMEWYLSTRENGTAPHGGFGMGFERLLAYLSRMDNIRDISAFPRAPNVCAC